MRWALVIAVITAGCDIPVVAYCPDGECPAPYVAPVYPEVTVVLKGPQGWHVDCDAPDEIVSAIRETVTWWNAQIPGVFTAESPCGSGEGVRYFYRPEHAIHSGLGGLGWVSVTRAGLTRAELLTVLWHETGHALGIGHVDTPGCLMYWKAKPGGPLELCQYEREMLAHTYGSGF